MHPAIRPPSVDRVAREVARATALPHALCVDAVREAIAGATNGGDAVIERAIERATALARLLQSPAINATGVIAHTNLGRAPYPMRADGHAATVEFDVATGRRGSRQRGVDALMSRLLGAPAAMVVNNNAAAVLLVLASTAAGREVLVSRGESVEIGGGFRIPEVLAQSGARLVDVGTTNRTRLDDYRRAIGPETAAVLKVHPSNYRVRGFVEATSVAELATLGVPVIADIGSGLIDERCPWLDGPPPAWLEGEPGARQTLAEGAAVATFSGDKLLGGPQAGLIVGDAEIVERCRRHPLARAVRAGGHIVAEIERVALSYLRRTVVDDLPLWQLLTTPVADLAARASAIAPAAARVVDSEATVGAGSVPGTTIASVAIELPGDHLAALRAAAVPVVARVRDGVTVVDLRGVFPADDATLGVALEAVLASSAARR